MKWWHAAGGDPTPTAGLTDLIDSLATPGFAEGLLQTLRRALPANSLSVYSVAADRRPTRFMAASRRSPDMTADCWRAYVDGAYRDDTTLTRFNRSLRMTQTAVCHVKSTELAPLHRLKVYQAHQMAERVSIVCREADDSVFALNCYRHESDDPFNRDQLESLTAVAPMLLALTKRQVHLSRPPAMECLSNSGQAPIQRYRTWLHDTFAALTPRELDVCERLLAGMPQEGIAADLALKLPTVKTYRNRAFERIGIHFRSELFALALQAGLTP